MVLNVVHIPEVIEPDEKLPPDLVALRKFSILMDQAVGVPGTRFRFGLDAALGLIPGIGDVIGAVLSAWIVAGALRHRVPMMKIMRMVFNIVVDLILGSVPFLGDVFDFTFNENMMNMRILMLHRHRQLPPRKASEIAAVLILIVIFLVVIGLLSLGALIAGVLWVAAQRVV
jgi:hypothetical protein